MAQILHSDVLPMHLRAWSVRDREALARLANNKKIWDNLRDYFPQPYTLRDATEWIRRYAYQDPVTHFAIVYDQQLAGAISLIRQKDIYRYAAEIGYWIGEPYWGRGLATAAVQLVLTDAFHQYPDLLRVSAEIFSDNDASRRVLQKNGFSLECVRKLAIVKNGRPGDDEVWIRLRSADPQTYMCPD